MKPVSPKPAPLAQGEFSSTGGPVDGASDSNTDPAEHTSPQALSVHRSSPLLANLSNISSTPRNEGRDRTFNGLIPSVLEAMPVELQRLIKNFLDWRASVNLSGTSKHFNNEFKATPAFSVASRSLRVFVPKSGLKCAAQPLDLRSLNDTLTSDFEAVLDTALSGFDALPPEGQLLSLRAIINIPTDVSRNLPFDLIAKAYDFVIDKAYRTFDEDKRVLTQAIVRNSHALLGPFKASGSDDRQGTAHKSDATDGFKLSERRRAGKLLSQVWYAVPYPDWPVALDARALSQFADQLRSCGDSLSFDRTAPLHSVRLLKSDDEKYDVLCSFARDARNINDEWIARAADLPPKLRPALLVMAINEMEGPLSEGAFKRLRDAIKSLPAYQRDGIITLLLARIPESLGPDSTRRLNKHEDRAVNESQFDKAVDRDKVTLFYDLLASCRDTTPGNYAKLAGEVWRLPLGARSSAFDSVYKHAMKLPEAMRARVLVELAEEFTTLPAGQIKTDKPRLFSAIGEKIGLASGEKNHLFATRDSAFRELLAAAAPTDANTQAWILGPLIASLPALSTASLPTNFRALCGMVERVHRTSSNDSAVLLKGLVSQLHLLPDSDFQHVHQALSAVADKLTFGNILEQFKVHHALKSELRKRTASHHESAPRNSATP